jgi:glutaminase
MPLSSPSTGSARSPVIDMLTKVYESLLPAREGKLADYIPELATVDPDRFGIAVAMADGHIYEIGDTGHEFSIQSVSKPLVYGMALRDNGIEQVLQKIGVEPTGEAFNSIVFDTVHNRPFNPMVNSGAIAATALIGGVDKAHRMTRILEQFRAFAGRALRIDEKIYASESATGHRNRAIAYLELNSGMISGDVEEHLELYFKQCAALVTARDLAVIAATFANGGLNPLTGERALRADYCRHVLSVMTSCGMYDYAGSWEFSVGLPAKSGVGGGIMAVLPGQLGIGIFSPRLDDRGNSYRGIKVCEALSTQLKLHMLDHRGTARTVIRRHYRGSDVRSKRVRSGAARRALERLGSRIAAFELQGDLTFANAEMLIRKVTADIGTASHFIIDAERVNSINTVARDMLSDLRRLLESHGKTMIFVPMRGRQPIERTDDAGAAASHDSDSALEAAERDLLRGDGFETDDDKLAMALEDFDLLEDFTPADIAALRAHLTPARYRAGDVIIANGDLADRFYFLERGSVDVRIAAENEHDWVRLSTIDAGNVFGEVAVFGGGKRTADVVARTPVELLCLPLADMQGLFEREPALHGRLLIAVGSNLAERLRRANTEISALAS